MALNELKTSFDEFSQAINEDYDFIPKRSIVLRRKYRDANEERLGLKAPVRTKVLEFIESKGTVTHEELDEFIQSVKEDAGKKPSWGWVRKNASLIDKDIDEGGAVSYSLTKRGKRILETYKKFEEFATFYKEKYYPTTLKTGATVDRKINKFLKFEKTNEEFGAEYVPDEDFNSEYEAPVEVDEATDTVEADVEDTTVEETTEE